LIPSRGLEGLEAELPLIASRGLEEPRRDAAERLRVRASMGLLLEENVLCNAARGLGALRGLLSPGGVRGEVEKLLRRRIAAREGKEALTQRITALRGAGFALTAASSAASATEHSAADGRCAASCAHMRVRRSRMSFFLIVCSSGAR
jgi:hypothetical protein